MADDYYKILGVERGASPADLQKAYRKLARKYHPDLHPDDNAAKQKFKEVQQAYDVLNDPKKREMYDRFGPDFDRMHAGGGPGGGFHSRRGAPGQGEPFDFEEMFGGGGAAGAGGFDFSQIFGNLGGGRGRRRAARSPGADIQTEVRVPFRTAVQGGETPLRLLRADGSQEELVVKIPAGIDDGKKVRLRGKGETGTGGNGDLYVVVRVEPHPFFHRRGDSLYMKLPITLGEAAEGTKVDVPTPTGVVSLRVPAGASSGMKLRVKGHGIAAAGKPAGDLFAELQIVLPTAYDESELEFVRRFDERHRLDPRRDLKW